jgi:hypothetical protein
MQKSLRLLGIGLFMLAVVGSAAAKQNQAGPGVEQRVQALEQKVSALESELNGIKAHGLKLTNCRTTPFVLPDNVTNCNQTNEVMVNVGGGHRDSEVRAVCCQISWQ